MSKNYTMTLIATLVVALFVFALVIANTQKEVGNSAIPVATLSPKPELTVGPLPTFPIEAVTSSVSFRDVRAIYATTRVALSPKNRESLIDLIDQTELNALVITVKDGDGVYLDKAMERVVHELRDRGVYSIARIVVFQDNDLGRRRPDLALKASDGSLWVDHGGYRWVDPASEEIWRYNADVALKALALGFNEVNLDYIRFPSDGDVTKIVYPIYDQKQSKNSVVRGFFNYFTSRVHEAVPDSIISADLFAFSFLIDDGMGVGQRLTDAANYFDVISPMVYPSHYTPGNFGFPNRATEPYAVVYKTLESGLAMFKGVSTTAAIRPWIQDFDIGAVYDATMVRAEIDAMRDVGLGNTWMVWNPSNLYEPDKFLRE